MRQKAVPSLVIAFTAISFFALTTNAHASLLDLLNGGSVTTGGASFFNFSLTGDDGTLSPDFSNITVSGFSSDDGAGLEFSGNGEFALGAGFDSIIFGLEYEAIIGVDQNYVFSDFSAGSPQVGSEGYVNVNSRIIDGVLLGEAEAELDPAFGINKPFSRSLLSSPTNRFLVQTNFSLFADSNSSVSLGSFRASTSAVPEPSSALVIGALSASLLTRRKRACQAS